MTNPTKGRKRMILVGLIAAGFLVAAWLVGAAPADAQDTTTVRAEMMLPVPLVVRTAGDSTFVHVDVNVSTDSLAVLAERVWLAQLAAQTVQQPCPCPTGGIGWKTHVAWMVTAFGVALILSNREETTTINVDNTQTVKVRSPPWHKPWRKPHGDDPEI